ncbi:hypothetical protein ANO14919_101260 [Xylariales sp. No.14919]|nr:hypothetical protein ANO14919_101260 [Xylariales sp. No.14919]
MMSKSLLFTIVWFLTVSLPSSAATTPTNIRRLSKDDSKVVIAVGKGSFTFTPNTITANPGEQIVFEFWSDGHSVARSQFGYPCMPYEYVMPDDGGGFWSGEMVNITPDSRPTFTITVNDTAPIFFYCSLRGSCKDNRMIGVINPNKTWTLDKQESFINPSILELEPGDPLPSEPAIEPTQVDDDSARETPDTSIGDIVGIAMGSIAVIVLAGVLAYVCRRQSLLHRERQQNATTDNNNPPLIHESTTERSDNAPKSPPLLQHYPTLVLAQPTNSGQWSLTSPVPSPCQSSFRLGHRSVLSADPSETSLVYHPEPNRLEVPGSPVPVVELPAGDVPKGYGTSSRTST